MQTYQYDRLDEQKQQIRLLNIVPTDDLSDAVQITLFTYFLDSAPPYVALSYAWGDANARGLIKVHGINLSITSSLNEALYQLRKRRIQCIWADAICINQDNNVERARQVGVMDLIFENADHVIIWLGTGSPDSDLAMRHIPLLAKVLPTLEQRPNWRDLEKHNLPRNDHPMWLAIGDLYRRPWFSRLWTFQEAVLATSLKVFCGDETADWESFFTAGRELGRTSLHSLALGLRKMTPSEDGFHAVDTVMWAKAAKEGIGKELTKLVANLDPETPEGMLYSQKSAHMHVASLLMVSQLKLCEDPRDRVYGILSLTSEQFRNDIEVSYTQEPRQLYLQTGKACLRQDKTLFYLQLLAGRVRSPDLPTWCLDLNQSDSSLLTLPHYLHAGSKTQLSLTSEATVHIFEDKEYIEVVGFGSDKVDRVVPPRCTRSDPFLKRTAALCTWLQECLLVAESVNEHQQNSDIQLNYAYAVTANITSGVENGDALKQAINDCLQDYRDQIGEGELSHRYTLPPERYSMFTTTNTQLGYFCTGRAFFTTIKGKVGIGPPEIQVGDVLSVIYGTRPVFVLRESASPGVFEFVGDAFVHGLMELDRTAKDDIGESQTFRII